MLFFPADFMYNKKDFRRESPSVRTAYRAISKSLAKETEEIKVPE